MSDKLLRDAGTDSGRDAGDRPGRSRFDRVLLATEGRPLSNAVIARALELVTPSKGTVRVMAIARVHGVSMGLPVPGLLPTRREWAEREQTVERAIRRLRRKGIEADGQVVGTRKGAQRICQEAVIAGCEAIVMAADPPRNRLLAEFYWSQEPQRVARRARVPVFLVPVSTAAAAGGPPAPTRRQRSVND